MKFSQCLLLKFKANNVCQGKRVWKKFLWNNDCQGNLTKCHFSRKFHSKEMMIILKKKFTFYVCQKKISWSGIIYTNNVCEENPTEMKFVKGIVSCNLFVKYIFLKWRFWRKLLWKYCEIQFLLHISLK